MHAPLTIALRPSPRLAAAQGVIHALAGACLLAADLPEVLLCAGLAGLLASAWRAIRRDALLLSRASPARIQVSADGAWRVERGDGAAVSGTPSARSVRHAWLCIVELEAAGRRRATLLLCADAMRPGEHRRVRVALGRPDPAARASEDLPPRPSRRGPRRWLNTLSRKLFSDR